MKLNVTGRMARSGLICLGLLGTATAVYAATTSTKVTSGASIDVDKYIVPSGSAEESNGNDPRAERYFTNKIPISEKNKNYSFSATYFVTDATRTTIAQLLNDNGCTTRGCDRYKPVLFLVAWKQGDSLTICSFESCKATWNNVPTGFKMTIKASGTAADVTINGTTKSFDLVSPANGAYRPNGAQEMRFGAYHHDVANGKAASNAKVRVYNITTAGY
jgi:hypothetical protein